MTAREGLAWRGRIPDARGMPRKPYQPRRGNPYRAALWPRRTALRMIPGPSGSLGRGMAGRWALTFSSDTAESERVLASWLDEVGGCSWRANGPTISLTACRPSIHGWTSWPAARKAHVSRPPTGFPAWPLLPDAPRTVFNDFASTAPALARHPYGLLPPFEVERLPSGPRPSCGRTRPTPRCDARAPSSDTAGSSRSIRNRQDDGAAGEPRERRAHFGACTVPCAAGAGHGAHRPTSS